MTTKNVFIMLASCLSFHVLEAQDRYGDFTETIQRLFYLQSEKETEAYWRQLVKTHRIPLISKDSVAFLYRGPARKVVWMGDFNGWGNSKTFSNQGRRIGKTDIWILQASLPEDARMDYKILIDDTQWLVDPLNPFSQWSGVGGGSLNSELRMPAWREDTLTTSLLPGALRGSVNNDLLFNSEALGYQLTYSVYLPPGYREGEQYPIMYVTDGYEYMHEQMGNMITVLDNLIHLEKIQPLVAVFIDHRDPVNRTVNRRMQELPMNEKYRNFVTKELLPHVEENYGTLKERSQRAIVGTSLGGLSAAWLVFSDPELFGMAGIQSPAFWFRPGIYSLCEGAEINPVKIFLTTGLINDAEEGAVKMKQVLDAKACPNEFITVNQGHSWGNWRDLTDDMLVYLFPR